MYTLHPIPKRAIIARVVCRITQIRSSSQNLNTVREAGSGNINQGWEYMLIIPSALGENVVDSVHLNKVDIVIPIPH